jgi:hypothetical protein
MECRCGMEFCYACGGVYNDCECSNREIRIQIRANGDDGDGEEIKLDLD